VPFVAALRTSASYRQSTATCSLWIWE